MWSNTDTHLLVQRVKLYNKTSAFIWQSPSHWIHLHTCCVTKADCRKIHHEAINISYISICVKHGRNFQCMRDTLVHLSSASVNEWQVKSANK
jgi:hypothetical protein